MHHTRSLFTYVWLMNKITIKKTNTKSIRLNRDATMYEMRHTFHSSSARVSPWSAAIVSIAIRTLYAPAIAT